MPKVVGKFSCWMGQHYCEQIEKSRGLAGGCRCIRKGCSWKIDPIKWPPPCPPKKN